MKKQCAPFSAHKLVCVCVVCGTDREERTLVYGAGLRHDILAHINTKLAVGD
jgi:hypothetical protein